MLNYEILFCVFQPVNESLRNCHRGLRYGVYELYDLSPILLGDDETSVENGIDSSASCLRPPNAFRRYRRGC